MTTTIAGRMPTDNLGMPIPNSVGVVNQDGSDTPVVSPATSITTTAKDFIPPAGAVAFIFQATAACRYGNNAVLDGSAANKGYKKGGALTDTSVPCANKAPIYIRAETGSIDVDFHFEVLS